MGSSTLRTADEHPPAQGGRAISHRARKRKHRRSSHEGRLSKIREGIVGVLFAVQLIIALLGLLLVPYYLMYEFIIE